MELWELLEERTGPDGRMHHEARVAYGKQAQDAVINDLQEKHGREFELISTAPPASQQPDIIANVAGNRLQFEVKNRTDKNGAMTVYNTTILPTEHDPYLDMFAKSLSEGKANNFNELMDLHKKQNPKAGWPHEEHSPKSGSINIRSIDGGVISKVRRQLMRYLTRSHDDYFVVVTSKAGTIDYYSIGTQNPLHAPPLPPIRRVILKTDGAPYKGKMRVALKIQLTK